jgi:hypothetical protein
MLILIKEDGSGKPDSNSYADSTDGDAYYDGHLYATAWTAATTANKEKALVMATRLIDSLCHFYGFRVTTTQSLQWPREQCPDPDKPATPYTPLAIVLNNFVDPIIVPKPILQATCEMARELLLIDRTTEPPGEGILSSWTSTSGTKYSKTDPRPILSHVAQAMLSKYGSLINERSGTVRLIRA